MKHFEELIRHELWSGVNGSYGEDTFVEIELLQFVIYLLESNAHFPFEETVLYNLLTRNGHALHCFDGIPSVGRQKESGAAAGGAVVSSVISRRYYYYISSVTWHRHLASNPSFEF